MFTMAVQSATSFLGPFLVALFVTSFLTPKCWFLSQELAKMQLEIDGLEALISELRQINSDLVEEKRRVSAAKDECKTDKKALMEKLHESFQSKDKQLG